jgi:hypothetical protein
VHEDFDDTVLVPSRRVPPRQEDVDEDTVVPNRPKVHAGAPVEEAEVQGESAAAESNAAHRPPALVEPPSTSRRRVPLTHKRLTETLRSPSAARDPHVLPPAVQRPDSRIDTAPAAESPTPRPAPLSEPVAPPASALPPAPPSPRVESAASSVPVTSSAHGFRIGDRAPVTLDVPALIGRRPTAPRVPGRVFPRLVRVSSPLNEVSSTHVELRQEGHSVIVTDLRSTNGTVVRMPGSRPVKLRQGESLVVRPGTQVDIGDGNILEILPPPRLTVPGDSAERGWS